jgi:hypothetical protein
MSALSTVKVLPPGCLLCGAPHVTWHWRAMPTDFGVTYQCDNCCSRLGPAIAFIIAQRLLLVASSLVSTLRDVGGSALPVSPDRAS